MGKVKLETMGISVVVLNDWTTPSWCLEFRFIFED
jgi:hypothetical protein